MNALPYFNEPGYEVKELTMIIMAASSHDPAHEPTSRGIDHLQRENILPHSEGRSMRHDGPPHL